MVKHSKITDHAQQRATFAYEEVGKAKAALKETASEFKAHVKKVPLMIRTNGLAATYAFVQSKAKYAKEKKDGKEVEIKDNDYAWIAELSREWLKGKGLIKDEKPNQSDKQKDQAFAGQLAVMGRTEYRQARKELLALFTWLKRFSDGLIQKNEKEVNDGKG